MRETITEKWYQPNLMGLFVIGDVDVNKIKELITGEFFRI